MRFHNWYRGGPSGPWISLANVYPKNAPRLVVSIYTDQLTGIYVNVSLAHLGTFTVGWLPDHRRCSLFANPSSHVCFGWNLPTKKWGTNTEARRGAVA